MIATITTSIPIETVAASTTTMTTTFRVTMTKRFVKLSPVDYHEH